MTIDTDPAFLAIRKMFARMPRAWRMPAILIIVAVVLAAAAWYLVPGPQPVPQAGAVDSSPSATRATGSPIPRASSAPSSPEVNDVTNVKDFLNSPYGVHYKKCAANRQAATMEALRPCLNTWLVVVLPAGKNKQHKWQDQVGPWQSFRLSVEADPHAMEGMGKYTITFDSPDTWPDGLKLFGVMLYGQRYDITDATQGQKVYIDVAMNLSRETMFSIYATHTGTEGHRLLEPNVTGGVMPQGYDAGVTRNPDTTTPEPSPTG